MSNDKRGQMLYSFKPGKFALKDKDYSEEGCVVTLGKKLDEQLDKIEKILKQINLCVEELVPNNKINVLSDHRIKELSKGMKIMNEKITYLLEEVKGNYLATLEALTRIMEKNNSDTYGHCRRVSDIAIAIAKDLNFSEADYNNLELAGLLHDMGKIGIPMEILNKKGKLTDEEYEIVKKHPKIAFDILKGIDFLKKSREIIYQYHERIDGKGYPCQLTDDQISLGAKILAVADAYDAMTSVRPYRERPLTKQEAIKELTRAQGSQFDTTVVKVFINRLASDEGLLS